MRVLRDTLKSHQVGFSLIGELWGLFVRRHVMMRKRSRVQPSHLLDRVSNVNAYVNK